MTNPNKALEQRKNQKFFPVAERPASSWYEADTVAKEMRESGEYDRVRVNSRVQGRGVDRVRVWRVTGYTEA